MIAYYAREPSEARHIQKYLLGIRQRGRNVPFLYVISNATFKVSKLLILRIRLE